MKKTNIKIAAAILLTFNFITLNCRANNLTLGSTITVVSGDQISFTIKWDNSWFVTSAPNNWDAVWVFVKYKDCTTANWLHAPLSTTGTDHTVSGGGALLSVEMPAVNDGNGVFIRRAAAGSGTPASAETVTLKLGIATGSYNFKVFGIEMVNIPAGDFQVGDATSNSTFSNNTITAATQAAGITGATLGGGASNVPSTYPMGQSAFYCMKNEITQEQYVDFLNTLTYAQQATHTIIAPNSMATNFAMGSSSATTGRNRNAVKISTAGVASTTPAVYGCDHNNDNIYNVVNDGQNISCNYISWLNLAAYLDWACLRPMSDLEYEKICRGIINRIAGEYAWGSTVITPTNCTIIGQGGRPDEYNTNPATGNGLCMYNCGSCDAAGTLTAPGPFRVGYTATGTTTRITASATYYGVLDMSANNWERVVAVNATGVLFTGTLGDGTLDAATGNANVANWPNTTAVGSGYRGGSWASATANYMRISDRVGAAVTFAANSCEFGGRGVR